MPLNLCGVLYFSKYFHILCLFKGSVFKVITCKRNKICNEKKSTGFKEAGKYVRCSYWKLVLKMCVLNQVKMFKRME